MSKSSQESSPITQWGEKLEDMLLQLQTGTMYADNTEPATTNNRNIAKEAITSATISLIEALIDKHETYAQWVLEREEPKGLDKTVVRVEKLRQSLKELEDATKD